MPASGALPVGLILDSTGTISGTPTAAGTFSFTVQADENSSTTSPTTTASLTITITAS